MSNSGAWEGPIQPHFVESGRILTSLPSDRLPYSHITHKDSQLHHFSLLFVQQDLPTLKVASA